VGEGNPRGQYQGGIKRRVAHIAEREAMKLPLRQDKSRKGGREM
jgi:hypothetical protein